MLDALYKSLLEDFFSAGQSGKLEGALLRLARDPHVNERVPGISRLMDGYISSMENGDTVDRECALLDIYTTLHRAGSGYTDSEREVLNQRRSIECQPAGLTPLMLAARLIRPHHTVADLGAGNGLQGLLLQCIIPHAMTIQVEISGSMVETGRIYQRALGIGEDRVRWLNDDILNAPLDDTDFIYLYRPVKPVDGGNDLYRALAQRLEAAERPKAILSVADCLERFIGPGFKVLYKNDLLTCFVSAGRPL